MNPMLLTPATEELVAAVAFLNRQGWTPATSSNFSLRIEEGFLVSESGIDKGAFGREHLLAVDPSGRSALDEPRRSSAETLLHAAIYDTRPSAGCVLHTHSVNATVLSLQHVKRGSLVLEGYEILKGLAGVTTHEARIRVPVFENSQDLHALAARVRAHLAAHEAFGFLLAGHGLYTWGADVSAARRHVEVFEFVFECVQRLALLEAARVPCAMRVA